MNRTIDSVDPFARRATIPGAARCRYLPIQRRMAVVANGNPEVGNQTAARKPRQQQMAGAMSQQGAHVMGDNECAQQKLVRLVGCRDPKARPGQTDLQYRMKQLQQH